MAPTNKTFNRDILTVILVLLASVASYAVFANESIRNKEDIRLSGIKIDKMSESIIKTETDIKYILKALDRIERRQMSQQND